MSAVQDDPQALADACAASMWAEDRASRGLGMELVRIAPGEATVAMTVLASMVNGHGIGHGGYIFLLADSAFAFACNTYDQRVVAQHASISFLAAVREGDRLVASARERHRAGRSGVYDIEVRRAGDEMLIALFNGLSRSVKGTHLPPAAPSA